MSRERRAAWPTDPQGRPPHVRVRPGEVAPSVLLPGDPARVDLIASMLEGARLVSDTREYRVVNGEYRGVKVTVCSSGIGGPSAEIAMVELGALGARRIIRVGGTAALVPSIPLGAVIVNHAMVRAGGTSLAYAPLGYPAAADPAVVAALLQAARGAEVPHFTGVGLSTASYYLGQGRTVPGKELPPGEDLEAWVRRGVINVEMEGETVLTLGGVLGIAAGVVLAVHANRATDAWLEAYESAQARVARVALESLVILAEKGVKGGSDGSGS